MVAQNKEKAEEALVTPFSLVRHSLLVCDVWSSGAEPGMRDTGKKSAARGNSLSSQKHQTQLLESAPLSLSPPPF